MTIAACFLTPGGVVLGADSTTTTTIQGPDGTFSPHYFNHAQKLFEIGDGGTVGAVTWGLGSFADVSYRTLFARLGDWISESNPQNLADVSRAFIDLYWDPYTEKLIAERERIAELNGKQRDPREERELQELSLNLIAGFCIAGRIEKSRRVEAFEILFFPDQIEKPVPAELPTGAPCFWGVPNIIRRVLFGIDELLFQQIVQNEHWRGSESDLVKLVEGHVFRHPSSLPIREAIDYVHSCITTTCKSLKFSHLPPVCGGPVEVAAITTDRGFRWVSHKTLGEATL